MIDGKLAHFLVWATYALAAACFAFALFVFLTFAPSRYPTLNQVWTAPSWVTALLLVAAGILLLVIGRAGRHTLKDRI
jgi:hypothetical protein